MLGRVRHSKAAYTVHQLLTGPPAPACCLGRRRCCTGTSELRARRWPSRRWGSGCGSTCGANALPPPLTGCAPPSTPWTSQDPLRMLSPPPALPCAEVLHVPQTRRSPAMHRPACSRLAGAASAGRSALAAPLHGGSHKHGGGDVVWSAGVAEPVGLHTRPGPERPVAGDRPAPAHTHGAPLPSCRCGSCLRCRSSLSPRCGSSLWLAPARVAPTLPGEPHRRGPHPEI